MNREETNRKLARTQQDAAGIKSVRKKLNLTTTQLAAKCGVSRRTVEGWEQGRTPSTAALIIIKSLLEPNNTPTKTKK